jgi:hypothetical protein
MDHKFGCLVHPQLGSLTGLLGSRFRSARESLDPRRASGGRERRVAEHLPDVLASLQAEFLSA